MTGVPEAAERATARLPLSPATGSVPQPATSAEAARPGPLELFDVVVLGGGPGGLTAARAASEAGRSVALVHTESSSQCSWHHATSGHAFLEITRSLQAARRAHGRGVRTAVEVDFGEVMSAVLTGAAEYQEDSAPDLLEGLGVEILAGQPRFIGTDRIEVDGRRLQARRFVLAGGGMCHVPELEGLADAPYLTSATVWDLRSCPERLIVIGDGAEACEMAQAFVRLGAGVTLLRPASRLLPDREPEAARLVTAVLRRDGVEVAELPAGSSVMAVTGGVSVSTGERTFTGTELLIADGCAPDTASLGLELPGVAVDTAGRVLVDDRLRSVSAPAVFAVGHCVGEHVSAHVADEQSRLAVRNLVWDDRPRRVALPSLEGLPGKWHPDQVPAVVFTDPQVAWVGMSEAAAAAKYGAKARVAMVPLAALDRARLAGPTDGFVKLVAAPGLLGAKTLLRLVGMTVVGSDAGETLASGTLAIRAGIPLSRLASTLAPAGTWSGAVQLAASLFFAPRDGLSDRPAVKD